MSDRVPTQCDQCGQVDDHPKLHLGTQTYHHDCLPFSVKQAVIASSDEAAGIIAAAEGGTHGDALLAVIQGSAPAEAQS